jgi:phosphoribosylglycinamide formyltransferase-1
MTHRIAVFASGSGSNAEQLIRHFKEQAADVGEVALIVCNKPDAYVLERAKKWNVPFLLIDRELLYERTDELIAMLKQHEIDFIVLAGFLWLIPPALIEAYPQRIVNIHPALLPRYGGKGMYVMHVHRATTKGSTSFKHACPLPKAPPRSSWPSKFMLWSTGTTPK